MAAAEAAAANPNPFLNIEPSLSRLQSGGSTCRFDELSTHQGVRAVQTTDEAKPMRSVRSSGDLVNLRGPFAFASTRRSRKPAFRRPVVSSQKRHLRAPSLPLCSDCLSRRGSPQCQNVLALRADKMDFQDQ